MKFNALSFISLILVSLVVGMFASAALASAGVDQSARIMINVLLGIVIGVVWPVPVVSMRDDLR